MPVQEISYIPVWLYLAGLDFLTFAGIFAGYCLSVKAMKLSVLDAMRTEYPIDISYYFLYNKTIGINKIVFVLNILIER